MRWSSLNKVGLSGTSLALAGLALSGAAGCSKTEAKEDSSRAQVVEVATSDAKTKADEQAKLDDERRERREKADRLERDRQAELERANQPASSDPNAPWFLRPAGDTTPVSQQPVARPENPPIQSDPPKPVAQQPKPQPKPQPIQQRPNNWQVRAACGRG